MQIFYHQFGLTYTCGNELKHKVNFGCFFSFHFPSAISISSNFPCFRYDDDAMLWLWVYIKWSIVHILHSVPMLILFLLQNSNFISFFTSDALQKVACRKIVVCFSTFVRRYFWSSFRFFFIRCHSFTMFSKWFFDVELCYGSWYDNIHRILWIHWIVFRFMHTIFDLLPIIQRNAAVYW